MGDRRGILVPGLAALGILIAGISLVIAWWTVDAASGGGAATLEAMPFDTGRMDDEMVSSTAVVAVGVLVLVGLLSLAGGLALWLLAKQRGEAPIAPAPWLMIAGGALLIIGPLVAVATWPQGQLGFWDSVSGSGAQVTSGAGIGWYLSLLAGAMTAAGGFLGLGPSESKTPTS